MSDETLLRRLDRLETDNARLRYLLDQEGAGAELRHQTRNVLAVMRTILRRSAETSASVADYAAHLEGRFDVILRMQNAIARFGDGIDLHTLVAGELLVYGAREDGQVQLTGPRVVLPPKTAEILALGFHELSTNAMKFGALGGPEGRITVTWRIDEPEAGEPQLAVTWQEAGAAHRHGRSQHEGFGREVIERMLPYELKAKTSFELLSSGLRCEIRLALPAAADTDHAAPRTA